MKDNRQAETGPEGLSKLIDLFALYAPAAVEPQGKPQDQQLNPVFPNHIFQDIQVPFRVLSLNDRQRAGCYT